MRIVVFISMILLGFSACRTSNENSSTKGIVNIGKKKQVKRKARPRYAPDFNNLKQCLAVRGNGHYIVTHFGAMAGIVENFGEMDAMAGGSSSTFSMFFYDAILNHPTVKEREGRARELAIATLLKSGIAWLEVFSKGRDIKAINDAIKAFGDTKEAFSKDERQRVAGFNGVIQLGAKLAAWPQPLLNPWIGKKQGKSKLRASWDAARAAIGLRKAFSSPDVRDLVNPEVLKMLSNQQSDSYESYRYKVAEILAAAKTITAFSGKDPDIIFRKGVVNFVGLGRVMTRIADFYAGHTFSNLSAVSQFVSQCATEQNVGRVWGKLKAKSSSYSCEKSFVNMAYNFREKTLARSCRKWRQRLKRNVLNTECYENTYSETWIGEKIPVIVTDGVVVGDRNIGALKAFEKRYLMNQPRPNAIPINFNQGVKFGYWAHKTIANRIEANRKSGKFKEFEGDYKVDRFHYLGDGRWDLPFKFSPAEPGLSKYVPIDSKTISVGGWSDLNPVQILKLAGCEEVVYLARIGGDPFLTLDEPLPGRERDGVAEILNIQEKDRSEWYDSRVTALKNTDLVWCTDWNTFTDFQQVEMYTESYKAKRFLNPASRIIKKRVMKNNVRVDNPGNEKIEGCYYP